MYLTALNVPYRYEVSMEIRLLNRRELKARTGRGTTQTYEDIRKGIFPPGVVLSRGVDGRPTSVRWPSNEIDVMVAARIAGATDDDLRNLVARLMEARREKFNEIMATFGGEAA